MINVDSLICGKIVSTDNLLKNNSPIDGSESASVSILSNEDLVGVFKNARKNKKGLEKKDFSELTKLAEFIKNKKEEFIELIIKDSGFTYEDSSDLVEGTIEFCEDYSLHIMELSTADKKTSFSFRNENNVNIKFTSSPFGLIAATTPRNTPLITELTIIINSLWSGNSLVLRPSPGVAGTMQLLIKGLLECFNEDTLKNLNIVFSDAGDFVNASLEYSNLLHYVGSSKYLENTLVAGIKSGTRVLVDGDGCSLVVVHSTADIENAVNICFKGVTRCNGQICISIRAIVVDEKIYEDFISKFLEKINNLKVLPPTLEKKSEMGPLFSSVQVQNIMDVAKKYTLLSSNLNPLEFGQNYISPVVLKLNENNFDFLTEKVFGPIVGIASFKDKEWQSWITENPINLTDVVLSESEDFINEFLETSRSPRKVVNEDPTIESVFEPWGAFLPSGWNDVSYWYTKYRNYYQLVGK